MDGYFSYVSRKGLSNLKNYKYSGSDKSIVAKYLGQPFWNWSVQFLPITMAPNLVTLVGFVFIIISYVLMAPFSPELLGVNVPGIVFFIVAVNLFIYMTLDALDGKQARRTNSSSPLGELTDHGCDSVSSFILAIELAIALNVGSGWVAMYLFFMGLLSFYSGQWEEYHTGTLDLGYFNVTEAELIMISIHAFTAFSGSSFWDNTVSIPILGDFSFSAIMLISSTASVLYAVAGNVLTIRALVRQNKVRADEAILRFAPFLLCSALFAVWHGLSTSLVHHPHLFFCAWGFLFSNLIGRMVLCRVCEEPFKPDFTLLLPVVLGVVNSLVGNVVPEALYMWGLFLWSAVMFIIFARWVVNAITTELNIRFLIIKPPQATK